jgi:integrase
MTRRTFPAHLADSTLNVYEHISARMDDPVETVEREVRRRRPVGTLLPLHAVAVHRLVAEGFSPDEARAALPKIRGRKTVPREALSVEDLDAYDEAVDHVNEPFRTILRLLPVTGLRISEACGLRVEDVSTRKGRTVLTVYGKGAKERLVPLPPEAGAMLRAYMGSNDLDEWLFPGRGGPLGPAAVRVVTRRIAEDIGVPGLCPHRLRHTFGTDHLRAGADLVKVARLMGHESIKTTERYLHPTTEDLAGAQDRLERSRK